MLHKAFLADIIEHPDDDTPRLIFADWLDENGEAERAELIRLQIEASSLAEDNSRGDELSARGEAILAQREKEWLGDWSERLVRWTFRRGFLDGIDIEPMTFVQHGEELFRSFPVRKVRFIAPDGTFAPAQADIFRCPWMGQVRSLEISGSAEKLAGWAEALAASPVVGGLKELRLFEEVNDGPGFGARHELQPLFTAPHLAQLETLEVWSEGEHSGEEAVTALTQASFAGRLQALALDGFKFSEIAYRILAQERAFSALRRLSIFDPRRLLSSGVQQLLDSPSLFRLTELNLGSGLDIDTLGSSPGLARLTTLHLAGGSPSVAAWQRLAKSPYLRLKGLNLEYVLREVSSIRAILRAPGVSELQALAVWSSGLCGEWLLRELSMMPEPLPIRRFALWGGVTPTGVEQLAGSTFWTGLTDLRLVGGAFTAAALQALLQSPYFPLRLATLALGGTGIDDGALTQLAHCPRLSGLTRLELHEVDVGVVGLTALLESPYLHRLTALHLSGALTFETSRLLAELPGLPRLRELTIGNLNGETDRELRKRFGSRLRITYPEM